MAAMCSGPSCCRSLSDVRGSCARSSSGPATLAWCITPILASIAHARRVSSTRAIPNRAMSAAWSGTLAIPKGRCSAGRQARRRTRRPMACPGGSNLGAISSSSCTFSRQASARRFRCRLASTSPTWRRREPRSDCGSAARRSTSLRANADVARLEREIRRKTIADDLAAYTKLLEGDPENALRVDAVGDLLLQAGRLDEAIDRYRRSLAINPASASTHYNLGYALSARGRRDEAIAELREALRIDPDYAQAHNNLGALLQLRGDADEALSHFERAVGLRPDSVDALTNLGLLLSGRGRPADAVTRFRAALTLDGANAQALSGLAWIRATASDPALRDASEAVALAERAAAGAPSVATFDALAA